MTSQEPKNPQPPDSDIPDTEVIVVSAPTPVFVDSTGRRRRLLRRLAYAFGAVCLLYGGLISVSLAGGPVSSSAILPLPDLPDHEDAPVTAKPSPTPEPVVSAPPKTHFISEPLPRRTAAAREEHRILTPRAAAPTKKHTAPSKKPTPTATTSRTVESTSTPSTPATATPPASASPAAPKPPGTIPTPKASIGAPVPSPPAAAGGSEDDSSEGGTTQDDSDAAGSGRATVEVSGKPQTAAATAANSTGTSKAADLNAAAAEDSAGTGEEAA